MRLAGAFYIAGLFFPTISIAAECSSGGELWAAENSRSQRVIVYMLGEFSNTNPIVFEAWSGKQLDWRVTGEHTCSNGISVCGIDLPAMKHPILADTDTLDDHSVSAESTFIEEDGEWKYVVFANLHQRSARAQLIDGLRLTANWFTEKPSEPGQTEIDLPSYYRLTACIDAKAAKDYVPQ